MPFSPTRVCSKRAWASPVAAVDILQRPMNTLVFAELPQTGLIRFHGEDAASFLPNQLTCSVASLPLDRATYGAYCTPKGRVLASFLLWRTEQGYFMQLPAALRESIQKQLSKYILRAKVKAEDASPATALIG